MGAAKKAWMESKSYESNEDRRDRREWNLTIVQEIEREIESYITRMLRVSENYISLISTEDMKRMTEKFTETRGWLQMIMPHSSVDRTLERDEIVRDFENKKTSLEEVCTPIIVKIEGVFGSLGAKYIFLQNHEISFPVERDNSGRIKWSFNSNEPYSLRNMHTPYPRSPSISKWRSPRIVYRKKADTCGDRKKITALGEIASSASNLKQIADLLGKELAMISSKCSAVLQWLEMNPYALPQRKDEQRKKTNALKKMFLGKLTRGVNILKK